MCQNSDILHGSNYLSVKYVIKGVYEEFGRFTYLTMPELRCMVKCMTQ